MARREFLVGSCIILVAMIGISVLFGWLAAGRVLRPLRVMTTTARQISERNLQVGTALDEAKVSGDARLIHRLVSNLVDNAIGYNITGGRVEVKLAASTTEATLTVTNTGPPVPPHEVSRLLEFFQRAAPDPTASPNGLGLGLSIVAQIAEAHEASLAVLPRPQGGLTVKVSFPAVSA